MGREQKTTVISESGLYSLVLRSSKPEAKRFKKWITSEVLPSIRSPVGQLMCQGAVISCLIGSQGYLPK